MRLKHINQMVTAKLNLSSVEFDNRFSREIGMVGGWKELELALSRAYMEKDAEELYQAHSLLNNIYGLMTLVPTAGSITPEGSHWLTQLRYTLEREFICDLDHDITSMLPDQVPDKDYDKWLYKFIEDHPVAYHKAYTNYLADEASLEDIRFYLVQESAIDASTDDFLAALQIGAPNSAKLEIAANYWDEMGEGDHNLLHSDLFKKALDSFEITESETNSAFTLEALICGNLQTMLSLRREYFYYGVGYFAATEQLVPERFKALEKGWERVGLSDEGAEYHQLHIEVDGHHTERWYGKVIAPLARGSIEARKQMLVGVLYRLMTSDCYLNSLELRFPSQCAPPLSRRNNIT